MALTFPSFNPARWRSWALRLPLLTRLVILVIFVLWLVGVQSVWDEKQWGSLIPKEVGLASMYRINTYPLIHANLWHAIVCAAALTPLLERFEAENGTLVSLAMFAGPLSTFPAGLYLLLERGILRRNTAIMGASMWIFVLLGVEAIKAYRQDPSFSIGPYKIPTWALPLILTFFVSFVLSNTSFLGHICATGVGYLYGLGYLKFMAPPEKILRWFESKLNLLGRLPHYVSVDQKTFGRYGILPTTSGSMASNV